MKKTAPMPQQVPKVPRPPKTQVLTAITMPGKTLVSKLIKPVGAALVVLTLTTTIAAADTTVLTAPRGGEAACPFPGCKGTTDIQDVTQAPYSVFPGGGDMSGPIQNAI